MRHTFRYMAGTAVRPGAHVALSAADAHHLLRVVRRRNGDQVEVIDAAGAIWPATVVDDGGGPLLRVGSGPRDAPPVAPVSLLLGLADWGRIDLVVEKAAELGVGVVTLTHTRRVRRTPEPDAWRRRRQRLERVVEAAGRQAGRGRLTRVEGIAPFSDALRDSGPGVLVCDPRGTVPLGDALAELPAGAAVTLAVGPDTGFTDGELAEAVEAGGCICTLGAATLRTETAALVAMSLALGATGHLHLPPVQHPTGAHHT